MSNSAFTRNFFFTTPWIWIQKDKEGIKPFCHWTSSSRVVFLSVQCCFHYVCEGKHRIALMGLHCLLGKKCTRTPAPLNHHYLELKIIGFNNFNMLNWKRKGPKKMITKHHHKKQIYERINKRELTRDNISHYTAKSIWNVE